MARILALGLGSVALTSCGGGEPGLSSGSHTYRDPSGDVPKTGSWLKYPDIQTVKASVSRDRLITFAIGVPNKPKLTKDMNINVEITTDGAAITAAEVAAQAEDTKRLAERRRKELREGLSGNELTFTTSPLRVDATEWDIDFGINRLDPKKNRYLDLTKTTMRKNGTSKMKKVTPRPASLAATYENGVARMKVAASDLGIENGFDFKVQVTVGVGIVENQYIDVAPGNPYAKEPWDYEHRWWRY